MLGLFRRTPFLGLLVLAALALSACGAVSPTVDGTAKSGIAESYSGLIAASEFVVGPNRFPFGLVDVDGRFLEGAAVNVRFTLVDDESASPKIEAAAHWRIVPDDFIHTHDDGEGHTHFDFRGIYVVDAVVLPEPGIWVADFTVLAQGNQTPDVQEAGFRVLEEANGPSAGSRVPATESLTIKNTRFVDMSTRQVKNDELHNVSVAEALGSGEPFVVVFASPQFCVSAMCGPVVEVMDDAREALGGGVEFIHIEPWDLAAARERGELTPSAEVREWNLPSEPWLFVVDREGRVAVRIEGLVTVDEVVDAVRGHL